MYEAALDELRSNRIQATQEFLGVVRRAADVLADLVAAARDGGVADAERAKDVKEELKNHAGAKGAAIAAMAPSGPDAAVPDDGMDGLEFAPVLVDLEDMFGAATESRYRIVFTPMPELYQKANESSRLIRECLALGTGIVSCDASELPPLSELQPEGAYLTWTIDLSTTAAESAVREVFEFAEWDCELAVEHLAEEPAQDSGEIDAMMAALLAGIQSDAAGIEISDPDETIDDVPSAAARQPAALYQA